MFGTGETFEGSTTKKKYLYVVKSRSREIGTLNCCIALKFDRHIGSTAAKVPVKFQSDRTILNTNLAASRLYEILLYTMDCCNWVKVLQRNILSIPQHLVPIRPHVDIKRQFEDYDRTSWLSLSDTIISPYHLLSSKCSKKALHCSALFVLKSKT